MVLALAFAIALACTSANADDGLGPGAGPWEKVTPEEVGLSTEEVEAAAARVALEAPVRFCFIVIKDGKLAYENYYASGGAEAKHPSYSTVSILGTASTVVYLVAPIFHHHPPSHYGFYTPRERLWAPSSQA